MIRPTFIIPAYNAADTLDDALGSLRAQSVSAWDAVVVEDGSTDATLRRARRWAAKDERIRVIASAHRGASAARNQGIAAARSDWLVFLDADDWLAPHYLKHMSNEILRDGALDVVVCHSADIAENGKLGPKWVPPPRDRLFQVTATTCPWGIHAVLIRRSLIRSVGLFDPDLQTCEDWDLWQRVARTRARIAAVKRLLAFIRVRARSLTRADPEQLTRNGLTVVRRGHAPDPRVEDPDPLWAEGCPPDELSQAACNLVTWTGGVAIGQGMDATPLLEHLAPESAGMLDASWIAAELHHGVSHARCLTLGQWPALWQEVAPAIEAFLGCLEKRSGSIGLATQVLRELETRILRDCDGAQPILLGKSYGMSIDVSEPIFDVTLPTPADRLVCALTVQGRRAGAVMLPARSRTVSGATVAQAILLQRAPAVMRAYMATGGWHRPILWRHLVRLTLRKRTLRFGLHLLQVGQQSRRERVRAFLWYAAGDLIRECGLARHAAGHEANEPGPGLDRPCRTADLNASPSYDASYWDTIFTVPDPWQYTSAYERAKYEQTLSLLPKSTIGNALEIACAEGHFTVQLAKRVAQLTAADISDLALERAQERCNELAQVDFIKFDLRRDPIPGRYDLIVCSEALYYLGSRQALRRFAKEVVEHLRPGGHFLTAHANVAAEEPDQTGFDWGEQLGAHSIGEIFQVTAGLMLVKELRTPLYRIQLYERNNQQGRTAPPARIEVPIDGDLNFAVSSQVAWNGAVGLRATEVTDRLPILMYHRVAPEGGTALQRYRVDPKLFQAHLGYLQENGYYSVHLEDWRAAARRARGLPGRAVLITFDDAYHDFYEYAWPLLEKFGYRATVFVPVRHVGGNADWDLAYEKAPAAIMTWQELRHLAREGIRFGSHSYDHCCLANLSFEEIERQGRLSRQIIERELKTEVRSIAYPYGISNPYVQHILMQCGYQFGLTCEGARCGIAHHPMRMSRIEITPRDHVSRFAAKLGRAAPVGRLRLVRNSIRRTRVRVEQALAIF